MMMKRIFLLPLLTAASLASQAFADPGLPVGPITDPTVKVATGTNAAGTAGDAISAANAVAAANPVAANPAAASRVASASVAPSSLAPSSLGGLPVNATPANPAQPDAVMSPVPDSDSRLSVIPYDPSEVYRLSGCVGFQTTIALADNEHVDNVSLGDSAAWQVAANKRGNLLFVKPTAERAFTNMTVVTDKRSYNFELRNASESDCNHGRVTYQLRFRYPPDAPLGTTVAPSKPPAPDPNAFLPAVEKRNSAYSYTGASDLIPLRVFDDGLSTYFKWSADVQSPAVYALNSDNSESIINYASRGDYLVAEQVARAFVLRRGNLKATLYNDAYKTIGLDAQSPQPRKGNK